MALPRHLREKQPDDFKKRLELENMLKNIVIRMLEKIREEKQKPSMKDMIQFYMLRQQEKDERARIRLKENVLKIYEQKNFEEVEDNDASYNKVIIHIERLLKITTAHTLAIDNLERLIGNLSKRKKPALQLT